MFFLTSNPKGPAAASIFVTISLAEHFEVNRVFRFTSPWNQRCIWVRTTTFIKQSKDHYYLSEFCTICFSKSEPRLRPWEVEMSSKAFIVTGFLGPSSFLSTTRFLDSYNQTNKNKNKTKQSSKTVFLRNC